MIFTEAGFFLFFALTFAVTWALPQHGARKLWLLAASYVFYGMWNWTLLWLIAGSTLLDYLVGLRLASSTRPAARRAWLILSLAGNLGLLGLFKYYDFFITSGAGLLQSLGYEVQPRTLGLILPAGISFYTFQTLSYSIDVYRRELPAHRNLIDFSLFVSFFPQLVAGPIVRASDFLPQLAQRPRFADVPVRACLTLFLLGFLKKACLSDNVAPIVDAVFADPAGFDAGSRWLGAALYALQIYCDFSGYSDMAIATAGLLGYRLTLNFDLPYLARGITVFWRRWHISLSTWFRDYLYLPLGGNRGGRWRTYRNLAVVFLLCGLWHGANWTFVAWGLFHGAFLIFERLLPERVAVPRWPRPLAHAYTLIAVLVGWILFRSADLAAAGTYLAGLLPGPAAPHSVAGSGWWWLLLLGFAAGHAGFWRGAARRAERAPTWAYAVGLGLAIAVLALFVAPQYQPFIYFQF